MIETPEMHGNNDSIVPYPSTLVSRRRSKSGIQPAQAAIAQKGDK